MSFSKAGGYWNIDQWYEPLYVAYMYLIDSKDSNHRFVPIILPRFVGCFHLGLLSRFLYYQPFLFDNIWFDDFGSCRCSKSFSVVCDDMVVDTNVKLSECLIPMPCVLMTHASLGQCHSFKFMNLHQIYKVQLEKASSQSLFLQIMREKRA